MNFKFIKPVYFGDTITCSIMITKIEESGRAEVEVFFVNQVGDQVCYAHLTGRVPLDHEKDILERIVYEGDPTNKLA
jgi:acyl dehydratase